MRRTSLMALWALTLGVGVAAPPSAHAQTGGPYDMTWSCIAGGGGAFSTAPGSGYDFGGTIGQPDAGTLTGGGYTVQGGFWGGLAASSSLYLPLVQR